MQFRQTIPLALCILFALISTGCVNTHIQKFRMTASESPEVHGANTFQTQHSASWRITGQINANTDKQIDISNKISNTNDLDDLFDSDDYTFKNASYKMGGIDFTGKIDFLYKRNYLVFGAGAGYKDGIYHHFTIGANYSHFEFGAFIGGFHQYSDLEYSGYKDDSIYVGDHHKRCNNNIFAGAYTGFYFDGFFFNYSASTYKPSPKIEDESISVPGIFSNYFTIGYRFNQLVEVSFGGIATFIDTPTWNFGITSGITIYLK